MSVLNARCPRLSADGRRVACGLGDILVGVVGEAWHEFAGTAAVCGQCGQPRTAPVHPVRVGAGFEPQWYLPTVLLVKGLDDKPHTIDLATRHDTPEQPDGPSYTHLRAGGGDWLGAEPGSPLFRVACSRTGQRAWLIEHNHDNNDHSLFLEEDGGIVEVTRGSVHEPRVEDGLLVWTQDGGIRQRTRGRWPNGSITTLHASGETWEGIPVPVMTPAGPWNVVITNTQIRAYPWGETRGQILTTGEDENREPDALWFNGAILCAYSDKHGTLPPRTHRFTLAAPRVELDTSPPVPEPDPMPTYRDGRRDLLPYLTQRWNELGVPAAMAAIRERTGIHTNAAMGQLRQTDPARVAAIEADYKAVQIPAFIRIVSELHWVKGYTDVGLSIKNGGNRWTVPKPDGRSFATDIVTLRPLNMPVTIDNFVLVDALTAVGYPETAPTWPTPTPNKDPDRPWATPPNPADVSPPPGEPPRDTHRYIGGGNDREPRKCDQCGKPPRDSVHEVPEGKVPHTPWRGEDGIGGCDLCFTPDDDPIHDLTDPPEEPPQEPPVEPPPPASLDARVSLLEQRLNALVENLRRVGE